MAQQPGWKSQLIGDVEPSFGTDPTTPAGRVLPIIRHTIKAEQNLVQTEVLRGRRDQARPSRGYINVAGDVIVPLEVGNLGWWMAAAFGGTSPYSVANTQPSLVLVDQNADATAYAKYSGMMINRLSFRFGGDGELQVTISFLGAAETVSGTAYDADPTPAAPLIPVKFSHLAFKENETAFTGCREFTVDIDFGLDGETYTIGGGAARTVILPGLVKVSGQVTALLDGTALWSKAVAGTETSLAVEAVPAEGKAFKIVLPEVELGRPTKDLEGPRGRLLQFPFEAYYDDKTPDTSLIQITVDNGGGE